MLELQKLLNQIGAYAGKLDGWFGDTMKAAVALFHMHAEKGEFTDAAGNPVRVPEEGRLAKKPRGGVTPAAPLPQPTDNVHPNWTKGFNRNIADQNKLNNYIYKSTKNRGINPNIFKSLIGQESGFDPSANNNGGYAGLTQVGGAAITTAGFTIGTTKKIDKKWVFDKLRERS